MVEVNLQLIKQARLEKGYTLQDMADLMGFKNKTKYYRREVGEYNFKAEELPMISNLLNIPLKKIFTQNVSKTETTEKKVLSND